ncbi:MAG: ATP-binding protein [Planctomycetota bacterium]
MAADATSPRLPSLRRRFLGWFSLLFVVGAMLIRLAYYQATVATLERDLDELIWSRLGMLRVVERFEGETDLRDHLRSADGRYLARPAAAPAADGTWAWLRRPRIDPGQLPWFTGIWSGDGTLGDGVGWPSGLAWDPAWGERPDTLWTTADGQYRLAAASGSRGTVILVGSERAALAAAGRTIAWFEVRSFLVWVPMVLGAAWFLIARLLVSLTGIAATARRIRGGHFEERIDLARTEAEFQELAGTINEMLDRLEAIRASQSRFNADVAHQLLNPVHAILLEADAAGAAADGGGPLDRIAGLARRIESLCEVLLAYSRSAALDPARLRPIDLEPVVADAIDRVAPLARQRGVTIEPPPGGAVVKGDPTLLEEVLVNLLGNAVEHSPAGRAVEVQLAARPAGCRLAVVDHGSGVGADAVPNLFERFHTGRPDRGHGVGLTLSRLIVQSHGGNLEHEPTPGGGATFVLTFPPAT